MRGLNLFTSISRSTTQGSMEDNLLVKKRRDDSNYAPKRFVLSQENGVLSIYSNECFALLQIF
ncbi:hypothetical protein Avbf_09903 [Armadillidium vulgare]|nr:hypothetical protein Avbf_09903 [Armadillidium vulgare]